MSKMGPCDKCSATAEHRCICGLLAACQASSSLRLLRSIQNDRVCKNCRFWDRIPEFSNPGSGECERIKGQYLFFSKIKYEHLESTARVDSSDGYAGLICKETFGCNLFEAGSIDDKKENPVA
jgi:hypothetical protein